MAKKGVFTLPPAPEKGASPQSAAIRKWQHAAPPSMKAPDKFGGTFGAEDKGKK